MACTRSEFLRWLATAAAPAMLRIDGDVVTIVIASGEIRIALDEQPPRRLGSIELPNLGVAFSFRGLDAPARHAFLERFDLHSRRGGG